MKKYENYKDSGIEWIGMIPSTWKVSRFNHNFSFSRGLPITKQDLKDNGIPCVSYGEIHSKFGRIVDPEMHQLKFVDESFLESNSNSLLFRGDFLFADTSEDVEGSGNFTCLDSNVSTFAGYHTVIARLLNREEFDYKYLSYFFDSIEFRNQIRSSVSGIKVFSITQGILKGTSIVVPTTKEQSAIASYLDRKTAEIDELIIDKKRLLQLYEEEKTSVINQAVTKGINPDAPIKDSGIECLGVIPEHWEVKRFDSLFSFSRGLPITKSDLLDTGIPCVNYGEIHSKYGFEIDPERHSLKYVKDEFLKTNQKSLLEKGDFVFADTSEDIEGSGNFTYLNSGVKAFAGYHTIIGKPKTAFVFRYVAYFFNSLKFRNQIRSKVSGTKVYSITQSILKFTFIIFPPINEQQEIVDFIDIECSRINEKISKTQKLINLLTEYRIALISEVVTGKVKVID